MAERFGNAFGCGKEARVAGTLHDFGKYSQAFQNKLNGTEHRSIDHAACGASYLYMIRKGDKYRAIAEAINGHHDGLVGFDRNMGRGYANAGKTVALSSKEEYIAASAAFRSDFPDFSPKLDATPPTDQLERMLYTRMLFSCLVDADYTCSARNDDPEYIKCSENTQFDADELLSRLYNYRSNKVKAGKEDNELNRLRDELFERCGSAGETEPGLFTLTAPTGTGKTLALLHFALRHCEAHNKNRIIIVLPFLTLAEQNAAIYREIIPDILVDHSLSELPDEARLLAERWSTPVIITTSVRFFEALFADKPTDCRKLHNISDSVVVFDEAQSLPPELTQASLRAVNELCSRYKCTMLFSTATQPDFAAIKGLEWRPREIVPDNEKIYRALERVQVEWRIQSDMPLETIADEMAELQNVCVIVNLRRHARIIVERLLAVCPGDEIWFLTTDLCPTHRTAVVETIKERLKNGLPCRVIATQCIEAGVDLDFVVLYRALAPLDSIIQAAGRCNRNGKPEKGQVIVFTPEDRSQYPDNWYHNAAEVVKSMLPPFSISDPKNIREYYRRLFRYAQDKPKLTEAIEAHSYSDVRREYRLIPKRGIQILVPYPGCRELFDETAARLKENGLTPYDLKHSAPITVSSFAADIDVYAEQIPYIKNGKQRESDFYVLREQYLSCYSEKTGLCLPNEAEIISIF